MCRWLECPWCPERLRGVSSPECHPEYDGDAREGDLVHVQLPGSGTRSFVGVVESSGPYWPGIGATISVRQHRWSFLRSYGSALVTGSCVTVLEDRRPGSF